MLSETPVLTEIALLLLAVLGVLVAADELGLNPIPGWLLAGMLLGPGTFGWLRDPLLHATLLEGCGALLLFIIGVELRRRNRVAHGRRALLVGALHTLLVTGGIAGVLLSQGLSWRDGAFTATTLTLGCGALILPVALDHPVFSEGAGELTDGIFRAHVAATVLIALLPALLTDGWPGLVNTGWALLAGSAAVGLFGAAVWWWGRHQAQAPETELLLRWALVAAVVWLGVAAGLGLLVGALVAGLLVGRRDRAVGGFQAIMRLRPLFTAGFFVALGTQVDLRVLVQHAPLALTLGAAGLAVTLLATLLGGALLRSPLRTSALTGLLLAPTGTLSLALTESGNAAGLLPLGGMAGGEHILAGAAAPLLLVVPFLFRRQRQEPAEQTLLVHVPSQTPREIREQLLPEEEQDAVPVSAVLLVGDAALARPLAVSLSHLGIPLHVILLDTPAPSSPLRLALREVVRLSPAAGAALLVATSDLAAAQVLLIVAHRRVPGLPTLAIATTEHGRAFLELLGADPAVRDEQAGHEQLLAALLAHIVCGETWQGSLELTLGTSSARGREQRLVAVGPGVPAVGQPLGALGIERTYRLRLIAIYQGGRDRCTPTHRQRLWAGDVLVLEGQADQFAALIAAVFRQPDG